MEERTGGWGLALLGAIGVLAAIACGAWVYRWQGRTSVIERTWPSTISGEAYATIDHTAPWSEPWTKLCRIDATTHDERWCRSVPPGDSVHEVIAENDLVLVTLRESLWILDPGDGGNLATSSFGAGSGELIHVRVGSRVVIAWPTTPPTLRAIDLPSGEIAWSMPLDGIGEIDSMRLVGERIDIRGSERTMQVDPTNGGH